MKIVVLNSGGFDSTTLLLDLYNSKEEGTEIHSLYFSYGQLNKDLDSVCAKENAEKIGAIHHEIEIPKILWTKNSFYNKELNEYKGQYLEMRNLIFLSYAASLAESIGAEEIYCAILKGHGYSDTSSEFINSFAQVCSTIGIKFMTPFAEYEKPDLFFKAKLYGVGTRYKYISCDSPVNGEPCQKCLDCESLVEYNDMIKDNYPVMRFFTSGFDTHDAKFAELLRSSKITEMRVLINNDCQLDCKHCYHRNHELIGDILTDDELVSVMIKAYHIGVTSFHFAGKEPLYNDRMFRIIDMFRSRGYDAEFTVVTNGINVPKYINMLKNRVSKVFLSIDDEFAEVSGVRNHNVNKVVKESLRLLRDAEIQYEVFYDLTLDNIVNTIKNIEYWNNNYSVTKFYARTIRTLGLMDDLTLSLDSIARLHTELKSIKTKDLNVMLNMGCNYFYDFILSDSPNYSEMINDIYMCGSYGSSIITENYRLRAEAYCSKYEGQITLTADGYVLGCAMECSCKEYDLISSGNVRDKDLQEIIKSGKEIAIETNKKQSNGEEIYFHKCLVNPIDFQ